VAKQYVVARGLVMVSLGTDRALVSSYRLSIVTMQQFGFKLQLTYFGEV